MFDPWYWISPGWEIKGRIGGCCRVNWWGWLGRQSVLICNITLYPVKFFTWGVCYTRVNKGEIAAWAL